MDLEVVCKMIKVKLMLKCLVQMCVANNGYGRLASVKLFQFDAFANDIFTPCTKYDTPARKRCKSFWLLIKINNLFNWIDRTQATWNGTIKLNNELYIFYLKATPFQMFKMKYIFNRNSLVWLKFRRIVMNAKNCIQRNLYEYEK